MAPIPTRPRPSSLETTPARRDAQGASPIPIEHTEGITRTIEHARAAFDRQEWGAARDLFSSAAADEPLDPDDLDRSATAAYLHGHDEEAFEIWAAGHSEREAAGDVVTAARFGSRIAQGLGFKGDFARSGGWIQRSRRLLDEASADCVELGYLEHGQALQRLVESGDVEAARAHFVRALEIGERFGDRELVTQARIGQGRMLVYLDDVAAGMALLDEAMVAVEAREIPSIAVGDAYCTVIDACRELFDLRRLRIWTESLSRWCDAQSDLVMYQGNCLLHRAEVLLFDGRWDDAVVEVRHACERLADPLHPDTLGGARLVEGDLHRLRGDHDAAEASYRLANAHGSQPQPGLSLLRLAQGDTAAADAGIARALAEAGDPIARARLLPAAVEIGISSGTLDRVSSAADELAELATTLRSPFLEAQSLHATGALRLAGGDSTGALTALRTAHKTWAGLGVPYEEARTRHLIASACRALGDRDGADLEEAGIHAILERLGAASSGRAAGENDEDGALPDGLTPREVEVLRVLAEGKTNRVIAEELFISEKTVASHVSHIFTKLGVTSRAGATAYAYDHHLV